MISVVYPLGKGSIANNYEIRMSIRSLEKNVTGIKDIWVVGEKPDFLYVNHIPAEDPHEIPDRNICEKIMKACENSEITDDFLFMNDDHFILKTFEASQFPDYYQGYLGEYVKQRGLDAYGRRAKNTYDYLLESGKTTRYHDIHTPILYNKSKFKQVMFPLDWSKPHGYIIKSLYANSINSCNHAPLKDDKGYLPSTNSGIFSTLPRLRAATQRFLVEQFPNPSRYEKH